MRVTSKPISRTLDVTADSWLTPLGLFLDLWACHKQFLGIEKAGRVLSIDDVVLL